MANSWHIRFESNGRQVAVAGRTTGKHLWFVDDPSDLLGRDWSFTLGPANGVTAALWNQYCVIAGWSGGAQFTLTIEDGDLALTSCCDMPLPLGLFSIGLTVFGLNLAGQVFTLSVDGANTPTVIVPLPVETRVVEPTCAPENFDDRIRRLIADPRSTIDGVPAATWLTSARTAHDPQRHACVLNLLAKLRTVPSVNEPLIDDVDHIVGLQLERMYVAVGSAMAGADVPPCFETFSIEGRPIDRDCHARMLAWVAERVPGEADAVNDELRSYRQGVEEDSLQVVVGYPEDPSARDGHTYADLDIDLGNPLASVRGASIHVEELASGRITDHIALHDALACDEVLAPFLYYRVTTGAEGPNAAVGA